MRPAFWIVSTGTELSQGRSRDTNAPEIALRLADRGFDVSGISILPDDPTILESYLRWILETAGVQAILMTGGLGPTEDDCTIDVLAKVVDSEVIEDAGALERLQAFAQRRKRIDLESTRRQVRILKKGEPIANNTGLAPGTLVSVPRKEGGLVWLGALPGVPTEMRPMLEDVLQKLQSRIEVRPVTRSDFYIYEDAESEFQRVVFGTRDRPGLADRGLRDDAGFRWGVAAGPGTLKVFLEHETDPSAVTTLRDQIRALYGNRFLESPVEDLLPALLLRTGQTISLAESCTGGLISKTLTDRPGSSAYFLGGAVVYANRVKTDLLNVSESILTTRGAVSEECALAMASGARSRFGTDFALAVTGIAGPDGGTPEKPVGTVFIAGAGPRGTFVRHLFFPLDRERVREYTARVALFHFFEFIQDQNPMEPTRD